MTGNSCVKFCDVSLPSIGPEFMITIGNEFVIVLKYSLLDWLKVVVLILATFIQQNDI
jgi:hypothetical protein